MCWELEKIYDEMCFDYLWHDYLEEGYGIGNNLIAFGIEFKDHETEMKCKNEFFELLTKWHNEGMINPQSE